MTLTLNISPASDSPKEQIGKRESETETERGGRRDSVWKSWLRVGEPRQDARWRDPNDLRGWTVCLGHAPRSLRHPHARTHARTHSLTHARTHALAADLKCASNLEKSFLFEEVFGGSYFDEGVELPAVPPTTSRPQAPLNMIDVGGNIGLFALYCLENTQGHIGRLITLEPVQETYELLLHNLDVFFDYNDTYLDGASQCSVAGGRMTRGGRLRAPTRSRAFSFSFSFSLAPMFDRSVIPLRLGMTDDRKKKHEAFYVFPRALGWSGRVEGVDRWVLTGCIDWMTDLTVSCLARSLVCQECDQKGSEEVY